MALKGVDCISRRRRQRPRPYMNPKKYTQHNPFTADGVDGLKEYISHFPSENHHLKVMRAFQDGPYFTQEEGVILGQNIFFEIFRFEDGCTNRKRLFAKRYGRLTKEFHEPFRLGHFANLPSLTRDLARTES